MPPNPPNALQGIRPALADLIALRARVLAWPPPQRAQGGGAGPATSPLRGRGMDYAESRLYAQGDDARHIDWRVTARTGRTHTKVFHAERDRVTLLIADTAPSLYFGTRRCFKSVLAAEVGALTAWAAQRSGDRISVLRGTHAEPPLPPAGSARGALRVLDALNRWYQAPPADDLGLEVALQSAARVSKPGTRLVALLDPRSVDAVADARWTALAAHHDAFAVLLVDPLELAPPQARVAFAGERARMELDLSDERVRRDWTQAFGARFEHARARLARLGWRVLVLCTDEQPDRVLAALLPHRREAA
jgi:uncharacterized protein (DUF58 family)